jgi:PRD1 phage membrane DNA delivery
MSNFGPTLITVLGGIFTLAMVAVIVSQKAQTSTVLTGAGTALSSVITAAVLPISGSTTTGFGSTGAPTATTTP